MVLDSLSRDLYARVGCAAFMTSLFVFKITPAFAGISAAGDINPAYNSSDPWVVGGDLWTGNTGVGTLGITNGSTVSSGYGYIGNQAGSDGTVTVNGLGSLWNQSSSVRVGNAGDGTMSVEAGAIVNSFRGFIGYETTGTGIATVTGTGSRWNMSDNFFVADSGIGTLNIFAGGVVENDIGYIGTNAGSTGAATVSDAGSQWNSSDNLIVGHYGSGELSVLNGASVTSTNGYLGYWDNSAGTATISGTNSEWYASSAFHVGRHGQGTLMIEAGGKVTNDLTAYIASNADSTGTATITGAGSTWDANSDLLVGGSGQGTLHILNGGEVFNVDGKIGVEEGSTGVVNVSGTDSRWLNVNPNPLLSGTVRVGISGNATLDILDGGEVRSGYAMIAESAGSVGSVTISGTDSLWWNDGHFIVGGAGTGSVQITDGGKIDSLTGQIGTQAPNSQGNASVSGAGSRWDMDAGLDLGSNYATGTLVINNGGVVRNSAALIGYGTGGTGTVTVSGTGSLLDNYSSTNNLFQIGSGGTGVVIVEAGGQMQSVNAVLGRYDAGSGSVLVTGASSQWVTTGTLTIGSLGVGDLAITSGGSVTSGKAVLGENELVGNNGVISGDGTALIEGLNSTWDIQAGLYVGAGGSGSVTIKDGGSVNVTGGVVSPYIGNGGSIIIESGGRLTIDHGYVYTGAALIASDMGTPAAVTVTGAGSRFDIQQMIIGPAVFFLPDVDRGTLRIEDGASLNTQDLFLAGTVTLTGPGSHLNVANVMRVGQFQSGTLTVSNNSIAGGFNQLIIHDQGVVNLDGGTIQAQHIDNSYGGIFNFNGGTLVVGSLDGGFTQSGGTLSPGNSPGKTTINGDYTLNAGAISIELGGTVPQTGHDQVAVTGTLHLDAASVLDVTLINVFSPFLNDRFDLFDFASISGAFSEINLPALSAGLYWDTASLYVNGEITVALLLPGDTDGDGDIDDADLGVSFSNYTGPGGSGKTAAQGDTDGDGDVDDADLAVSFSGYTGPLSPSVPEPGAVVVLAVGALALTRRAAVRRG